MTIRNFSATQRQCATMHKKGPIITAAILILAIVPTLVVFGNTQNTPQPARNTFSSEEAATAINLDATDPIDVLGSSGIDAPHGISVVYNGDVYSRRGLTWVTSTDSNRCDVQYTEMSADTSPSTFDWDSTPNPIITTAQITNYQAIDTSHSDSTPLMRSFKTILTDLTPGKTYAYRIRSYNNSTYRGTSDTGRIVLDSTTNNSAFSFINISDSQGYSDNTELEDYRDNVAQVLKKAIETTPDPKFILHNGDHVSQSRTDGSPDFRPNEWNWLLDESRDTLMNYPLMSATGNHENGFHAFYDRLNHAYASGTRANSISGGYYSFEYQNAFFAVLNLNQSPAGDIHQNSTLWNAQLEWLKQQLGSTTAPWKFVMFHQTVFTPVRDVNTTVRNTLLPIMSQYQVDLVFQGHDHSYMRTNPYSWGGTPSAITNHSNYWIDTATGVRYAVNPEGTIYLLNGHTSNKAYRLAANNSNPSLARLNNNSSAGLAQEDLLDVWTTPLANTKIGQNPNASHMFTSISINQNQLTVTAYKIRAHDRNNISILESYGIIKDSPPTPPTITITGITNGETISPVLNTKLTATATHPDGIAKLEIYLDNRLVGSCNEPQTGTCTTFLKGTNTTTGNHTIRIKATAKDTANTENTTSITFRR